MLQRARACPLPSGRCLAPTPGRQGGIVVGVMLVALLGSGGAAGCRRPAPEVAPVAPEAGMGQLEVLKDGRFLFTYVEPSGAFATTDKPEIIPEIARTVVRVIDPAQTKSRDAQTVYVVDVNELLSSGKAAARPLAREAFETGALAQLPPGDSSRLADRGGAPGQNRAPAPVPQAGAGLAASGPRADGGAPASPPGQPVVTIYGTSWCGACRTARQYFADRKIPFADKDVEADAEAAKELSRKAARFGIPTDRVPILEVRGRMLLGFDRARVEALLGAPS